MILCGPVPVLLQTDLGNLKQGELRTHLTVQLQKGLHLYPRGQAPAGGSDPETPVQLHPGSPAGMQTGITCTRHWS